MSDVIERLRKWANVVPVPPAAEAMHDAADEIMRLRDELASVTRHMELADAAWLRETAGNSPVAITLSGDERKAIEWAARKARSVRDGGTHAATLRKLLERLGGDQ